MQENLYFVVKMCFLSVFFLITQETGREIGVFLFNFAYCFSKQVAKLIIFCLISPLKYGSW